MCVTDDWTSVRPGETVTDGLLGLVMVQSSLQLFCGLYHCVGATLRSGPEGPILARENQS
jgi:hypothetical protein